MSLKIDQDHGRFRHIVRGKIRQNLRKHEIPESVIDLTLEKLRQDGLANDNEFAQTWVENRSTFRPRSRRMLAMELRQKGLDNETVDAAISGVDENALAYEAAQKRLGRLKDLEWNDFRKKLSEFLGRRGFPYSVTAPIVTRLWSETHPEDKQLHENFESENEDIS